MITIEQIGADRYPLYAAVPAQFEVRSILRVEAVDNGLGGFRMVEEPVATPFIYDYNAQGDDQPDAWAKEFDLSEWGIFLALDDGSPVGGAAVAVHAPVYPMDRFQRADLAVLWNLRVHPDYRRRGVGARLFRHAAAWARLRGFGQLGLETQNINVGACRFYAKQGCTLGAIHRFGYAGVPEVADQAMLLWYLDLREYDQGVVTIANS